MSTHGRWLALLLVGLTALISCTRQIPPRVLPAPSHDAVNSPDAVAAPEPSPTFEPLPETTVPPSETPSPVPTIGPTRTPTMPLQTPTPFLLLDPQPSDADVLRFLFSSHYSELPDDFVYRLNHSEAKLASRRELDVDGDGKNEIIVTGYLDEMNGAGPYLAILKYPSLDPSQKGSGLWQELLFVRGERGRWDDKVKYWAESNQVIVDFIINSGGTGISTKDWYQHWIRCGTEGCREIWSGERMSTFWAEWTTTKNAREFTYWSIDRLDASRLEMTSHHFATIDVPQPEFLPADLQESLPTTRRVSGPVVREVYDWDGKAYTLTNREEIGPSIEITREFNFGMQEAFASFWRRFVRWEPGDEPYKAFVSADQRSEVTAFWGVPMSRDLKGYEWESESAWPLGAAVDGQTIAGFVSPKYFPLCRISVQQYTGTEFKLIGRTDIPCTPNFTRLAWADVDGDKNNELLVLTYKPNDVGIVQLIVFRAQNTLTELARVDGTTNGQDGVGIKWEKRQDQFIVYAGVELVPDGGWRNYTPPCTSPWSDLGECHVNRYFKEFHWDLKSQRFVR